MPAARLGLGYDFDAMQQLVQVLGARTALDLFLTARTFDAAEARRLGVVHDVFASGVYAHDVGSLVDLVASNAPLTMKAAKVAIRGAVSPQPDAVRARVETLVRDCFASRDYQEGQNAFRERRPAEFVGA
jgi:enoyl-CoA hydratase/carnithine racemase